MNDAKLEEVALGIHSIANYYGIAIKINAKVNCSNDQKILSMKK